MKAIVFDGPDQARLAEVPEPSPEANWARVRIKAAGICATDFEVLGGRIRAQFPLTPGHEWSGVVDRVGTSADAAWIGRRVVGDNELTCLECRYCRRGEWRRCVQYRQIGFEASGAYAEYLLVPVRNLHALADTLSFEQGALLEPLGVGIAVAQKSRTQLGSTAVIMGAGPIGLSCLAAIKASGGMRILCLEREPRRLNLARSWGAWDAFDSIERLEEAARNLHPEGTDIVVDATGNPKALEWGGSMVRFGGTFVLAGYFGGCTVQVKPDIIHQRNVHVTGAGNNSGFTGVAASVAGAGILKTDEMITHKLRLDDWQIFLDPSFIRLPELIKSVIIF